MRIYALLDDVGSEYETIVPIKLSLHPFEDECYYIDLLEDEVDITTKSYENIGNWIPYNVIMYEQFWFDPGTNHAVKDGSGEEPDDNYLDGFICKEYKEGILTKTYFEDVYSRRIFPIDSCK